jgi:hypothetical protein
VTKQSEILNSVAGARSVVRRAARSATHGVAGQEHGAGVADRHASITLAARPFRRSARSDRELANGRSLALAEEDHPGVKSHPAIKLKFSPTDPVAYNAALASRLKGGSAGDIITCRPFDESLNEFK